MKYVISWFERPQGSPAEYENAQKRILEVFGQWTAPATSVPAKRRDVPRRPLNRNVCALHGRELMGCKSPVGVPTWTHRERG